MAEIIQEGAQSHRRLHHQTPIYSKHMRYSHGVLPIPESNRDHQVVRLDHRFLDPHHLSFARNSFYLLLAPPLYHRFPVSLRLTQLVVLQYLCSLLDQ